MTIFPYQLAEDTRQKLGLIVLQADETIEDDFRRLFPASVSLLVSRVPSDTKVTTKTLGQMEGNLTAAAAKLPQELGFDVIGYGCTSGTAQIGAQNIARQIQLGTTTRTVTQPVSALVAACNAAGINKLALLSPYVEAVSSKLRNTLAAKGIETPIFGTFAEAEEAKVARIDPTSIATAAKGIVNGTDARALFLSCTNLRTLDVIPSLENELDIPVLSSNLVLAWHMLRLSGAIPESTSPSALLGAKDARNPG